MEGEPLVVKEEPPVAQLQLHRGPGLWYVSLGGGLLVLGLVIPVTYLLAGRWITATLCGIPLLVLGVLIGRLGLSILRTRLTADQFGLRGRTPEGHLVDLSWDAVTIDAGENRLLVVTGEETVRLDHEAWVGFWDFVALLDRVPAAAGRLTPSARDEVAG